jgi:transposase
LIPGKRQSGGKDLSLHITKAGNKYLRTALV